MNQYLCRVKILIIALALSCSALSDDLTGKIFGESNSNGAEEVSFESVVKDFDKYKMKNLALTGKVTKVCQKKGCWFMLNADGIETRVTFKEYGFNVPSHMLDRQVRVVGKVKRKRVSVSEQRHYLEDENRPKVEIDLVKEPVVKFRFVAEYVRVL